MELSRQAAEKGIAVINAAEMPFQLGVIVDQDHPALAAAALHFMEPHCLSLLSAATEGGKIGRSMAVGAHLLKGTTLHLLKGAEMMDMSHKITSNKGLFQSKSRMVPLERPALPQRVPAVIAEYASAPR